MPGFQRVNNIAKVIEDIFFKRTFGATSCIIVDMEQNIMKGMNELDVEEMMLCSYPSLACSERNYSTRYHHKITGWSSCRGSVVNESD